MDSYSHARSQESSVLSRRYRPQARQLLSEWARPRHSYLQRYIQFRRTLLKFTWPLVKNHACIIAQFAGLFSRRDALSRLTRTIPRSLCSLDWSSASNGKMATCGLTTCRCGSAKPILLPRKHSLPNSARPSSWWASVPVNVWHVRVKRMKKRENEDLEKVNNCSHFLL